MKISQILNSIIIGIAVGAQPILGYNYGARNFGRVKSALKYVLGISTIISTIAFILFQTIPDKLIAIFGSGDELYIEFACLTFRTYLMFCICYGIQIPSGIFFQAIGKAQKSAILSLSRQVAFLIPAMIVLGKMFGLNGILYSGPFADGLASVLAMVFLIYEVKHLNKQAGASNSIIDDTSTDNKLIKHMVITISREYGSGGRYVGRLVADKLGIKLYDKDFIEKLAAETGLSEEYIENNEQKRNALEIFNSGYYAGLNNSDELFIKESELIKEVAEKESCVIIGRCADYILKDRNDVIRVFVYSSNEDKVKRVTEIYGLDKVKAEKEIKRINKLRANHYKYYTGKEWNNNSNYDICINSDELGVEKAANLICKVAENIEDGEINNEYGEKLTNKIIEGYTKIRPVTLRVNTIKTTVENVKNKLREEDIDFNEVEWSTEALIINNVREDKIRDISIYKNGEVYLQSLSSMLPPIILNPQEKESILDMTAAPGGKTTQIGALTNNNASITACELNKIRAEKLKYNIEKQGLNNCYVMVTDGRRLDDFFFFF